MAGPELGGTGTVGSRWGLWSKASCETRGQCCMIVSLKWYVWDFFIFLVFPPGFPHWTRFLIHDDPKSEFCNSEEQYAHFCRQTLHLIWSISQCSLLTSHVMAYWLTILFQQIRKCCQSRHRQALGYWKTLKIARGRHYLHNPVSRQCGFNIYLE